MPIVGRANTNSGLAELAAVQAAAAAYQSGPATISSGQIAIPSLPATGMISGAVGLPTPAPGALARPSSEVAVPATASSSPSLPTRLPTPVSGLDPALSIDAYSSAAMAQPRSAASILGWLVVAALLFGGVGAILFVAFGERGNHANVNAPAASASDAAPSPPAPTPAPTPGNNGSAPVPGNDGSHTTTQLQVGSGEPQKPTQPPVVPSQPRTTHHVAVAAADDHDPQGLIRQGQELQKQGSYELARTVYQKLEKLKNWNGVAEYYEATVAFDEHDTPNAVALASKAAGNLPDRSPMKNQAKMLFGDGLVQQGEFDRAKTVYLQIYKAVGGDTKEQLKRKISNCNGKLGKPDKDGL
jgi:tetratricopeptide (TPR) repeat protein